MTKTNLQKWIAYMKKTLPESALEPFPVPTGGDVGRILVVDSRGKPAWSAAVFDAAGESRVHSRLNHRRNGH